MLEPMPPIIIDTREQKPWVFSSWFIMRRSKIESGADYTVEGFEELIGIERKSLDDLVRSCTTDRDRFTKSLARLQERAYRCLVVEADMRALMAGAYHGKANPEAVLWSVVSMSARGIPCYFCGDRACAAKFAGKWLYASWKRAREDVSKYRQQLEEQHGNE